MIKLKPMLSNFWLPSDMVLQKDAAVDAKVGHVAVGCGELLYLGMAEARFSLLFLLNITPPKRSPLQIGPKGAA